MLDRLAGLEPDAQLRDVFDVHPLPGEYSAGPFELFGTTLPHFVQSVGIRLQANGFTLAYTGDTGPDPRLADVGRDADLFIVEATDRPGESQRTARNLMTAVEAGFWARQAGAHQLMLTHFWPGRDRVAAITEARAEFGGRMLAAEEGLRIELEGTA